LEQLTVKYLIWIFVLLALAALALWLTARSGPNLAADYQRERDAALAMDEAAKQPMITEESIAALPAPVQKYMRLTGAVGKPRVANIQLTFDAEMFQKPGSPAMPGPVEQYERFDPPKRLFFMTTRMYGLPVTVLHNYDGVRASMVVRVASLVNMVHLDSEDLARSETVTVLNDLCLFAPSWLTDQRLEWRAIDDLSATVTFTNGPHRVSATLVFNQAGELVDFFSDDRGALQTDGSMRWVRWSTPMRTYRDIGNMHLASEGDAVWHYPEGAFVYGKFKLTGLIGR
jgi:hypothetical protein